MSIYLSLIIYSRIEMYVERDHLSLCFIFAQVYLTK